MRERITSTYNGGRYRNDNITMTTMMETLTSSTDYRRTYAGDVRSATEARHDARTALGTWRMDSIAYDVMQVVAELMANAVSHCSESPVVMELVRIENGVRVVVLDSCTEPVTPRDADLSDENGRGMCLVEAFSHRWSWEFVVRNTLNEGRRTTGKRVWADFYL